MPQRPSTSDQLRDQHTSTKHLLPLAQTLVGSSGSSFSAGRGVKQPQVAALIRQKKSHLNYTRWEYLFGSLKLTLPPHT